MAGSVAGPESSNGPSRLAIVVYADGRASVGGVPVTVPAGADLAAVRGAALSAAIDMAVRKGGPLRASAFEPDGTAWPLLIHPDGQVEEDDEQDVLGRSLGQDASGGSEAVPPPAAPVTTLISRTQTIALNSQWLNTVESPKPPERFQERLARISEAGEAGRAEAAMALALDLEREVAQHFGETHPHALHARAVRAYVISLGNDWVQAADLYVALAADWFERAGYRSHQARRSATNAHYCWLRVTEPEERERIGEAVVRMWLRIPGAERQVLAARKYRDDTRS
ncbi:hypothetical protein ACGFMM_10865 [Streptomyces sp. NPDC048604]|uniref:hypothetical protein n=1 Tax=Streptomyces sp. NPDC048604 TaxID=3365578 RepID=UPI00371998E1